MAPQIKRLSPLLLITGSVFILAIMGIVLFKSTPNEKLAPIDTPMNTKNISPESINALIESGDTTEAKAQLVTAIADPTTEPFNLYVYAVTLFTLGNKEQAAFAFYLAQTRTRAQARVDPDPTASGALRGALNDQVGTAINGWVASDLEGWKKIAFSAIAFDKKLGAPKNPFPVSEAEWQKAVAEEQLAYETEATEGLSSIDAKEFAANRASAGLYVGPWQDPGDPLPAQWK